MIPYNLKKRRKYYFSSYLFFGCCLFWRIFLLLTWCHEHWIWIFACLVLQQFPIFAYLDHQIPHWTTVSQIYFLIYVILQCLGHLRKSSMLLHFSLGKREWIFVDLKRPCCFSVLYILLIWDPYKKRWGCTVCT